MPDIADLNFLDLMQESKTDKTGEEQSWFMSLSFVEGRQWLEWDRTAHRYLQQTSDDGERSTINRMLGYYSNMKSKLSAMYPSARVLPSSPSTEDQRKAKAAETALRFYWQEADIKHRVGLAVEHLLTAGTAAFHTYYDGEQDRVRTDTVSPFNLFFEKGSSAPEESDWIAIRTYFTRDQLKEAYPDLSEQIEDANPASDTRVHEHARFNSQPEDKVEVFEWYWRDGTHVITLGDLVLFEEMDETIAGGRYFPIQIMRYVTIPGRLWGISMSAPLVQLQYNYNRFRSRIMENAELIGNPPWLNPRGADVALEDFNNVPGQVIDYTATGGGKPEQMSVAPLPNYVIDNVSRIQSEMDDVAGIHSVSQGKRAIGIDSGTAIKATAALDVSSLRATQDGIERAVAGMAKAVLVLMKQNYGQPKMMRILDARGGVIWQELSSTDLLDDPEVRIDTDSLFRDEAQDRDAKTLERLQLGLIDKETAIKELNFHTGPTLALEQMTNMAHARDILEAAKKNLEVEIFRTDDIKAFSEVFREFIRDPAYYQLPIETQNYIRDIFVAIEIGPEASDQQFQEASTFDTIFPRETKPTASNQDTVANLVVPDSALAQQQQAGQLLDVQDEMVQIENAEAQLASEQEALRTSVPGGGAL